MRARATIAFSHSNKTYSNRVSGTERLHGWRPPKDGRRVYEKANRACRIRLGSLWPRRWPWGWAAAGAGGAGSRSVRVRPGARTRHVPGTVPAPRGPSSRPPRGPAGFPGRTPAPRRPAAQTGRVVEAGGRWGAARGECRAVEVASWRGGVGRGGWTRGGGERAGSAARGGTGALRGPGRQNPKRRGGRGAASPERWRHVT